MSLKSLIGQFLKFGVVGVLATIVDFGVMILLHEIFGVNPVAAAAVSYCVSLAFNSYALLDSWTLQAEAVSLQGLEMDGHHVSGTAEVPEAGILALSIPYDSGWSVEVDGKPARLLQVNGMMMGVQLDPGTHQVTFTYRNRWLAAGAVVSAATLALIGLGALLRRRRRGSQHQGVRRPRPIQ